MDRPQTAVVIGGASSLGTSLSTRLSILGYRVVLTYHNQYPNSLNNLTKETIHCDLCVRSSRDALIRRISDLNKVAPIQMLFYCAGINKIKAWVDQSRKCTEDIIEINFIAAQHIVMSLIPLLGTNLAKVVLIGSTRALSPAPYQGPYSCSKSALHSFAISLNREQSNSGVKVTSVILSGMKTPMIVRSQADLFDKSYGPIEQAKLRARTAGYLNPATVSRLLLNKVMLPHPPETLIITNSILRTAKIKLGLLLTE